MSYSKEQEESTPPEPEKPPPKASPIPLALAVPLVLEVIISQTQFPVAQKTDFFQLAAHESEENLPLDLDLTPEALSLAIQILRESGLPYYSWWTNFKFDLILPSPRKG